MGKIKLPNDFLMYPIISNLGGNMHHAYEIWVKFTGYLKEEEIEFLKEVESKNITDISVEDLNKYKSIKEQLTVHELLKDKYKNKNCTKEEHNLVYNFMEKGLREFIEDRITMSEKIESVSIVRKYKTKEELEEFVKSQEEIFNDLDVYNTYIYIIASQKLNVIYEHEFQERIRYEEALREHNLRKQLIKDYGLF